MPRLKVAMLTDVPLPSELYGARPQPTPVTTLLQALGTSSEVDVTIVTLSTHVARRTEVQTCGLRTVVLPQRPLSGGASFHLPRVAQLRRELRRIQPDVVHAQGVENAYALAAVTGPFRHLVTIHGIMGDVLPITNPPILSLARVPGAVERIVLPRLRNAVAISPYVAERLSEHSRINWFHIPNAVAPTFFDRPRSAERDPLFVMAGTLYPLKGMHTAAEAVSLLRTRRVHGRLVIFGGAFSDAGKRYRHQLERLAGTGQGFTLEVHDWASPDELAHAMGSATATVVASETETMSIVMAESLAMGTPVIATSGTGPEHFLRGGAGTLFPYGDANALAIQMEELLTQKEAWRSRSAVALQTARAFLPDRVASQTLAAYAAIGGSS